MLLEACVNTLEEALIAQARGAHRVELCSRLELGGLTPDWSLVREAVDVLDIPVMVMIRPKAGDFVYTEEELLQMKQDIDRYRDLAIGGVVLGVLESGQRQIDVPRTALLAAYAWPMEITFHKAIDLCADPVKAIRDLRGISGVRRVLSSGGAPSAMDGLETLQRMQEQADEHLILMPGGRITPNNLPVLHACLGAKEYHGRAIVG
jgi:copper homeostasis protein